MELKIGDRVITNDGDVGEIINSNNEKSVFRVKFEGGNYVSPILSEHLSRFPKLSIQTDASSELGTKHNQGKPQLHLVPTEAIIGIAEGLGYGATKYGKWNFKKGLTFTALTDSLRRHTLAFLNGEDKDPESGIEHTKLILSNAAMLEWMRINKLSMDDRKGDQ